MRRIAICLVLLGAALISQAQNLSPAFVSKLTATLADPKFEHAQWGVKIVSLDTGNTLFDHEATKLMTPASNTKLFTAALALDRLGPDFRIKTSIYAQAKPSTNGTVAGNLVIYGRGDPTFSARFNGGDHANVLAPLVNAILASGVRRIEGDLVADDTYFRSPQFGFGWPWDDLQWAYAPPVSALNMDDNALGFSIKPGKQPGAPCTLLANTNYLTFQNLVRTIRSNAAPNVQVFYPPGQTTLQITGTLPAGGPGYSDNVSVQNPTLCLILQLKDALARKGVVITGHARLHNPAEPFDPARWTEIATTQSPPLRDIVKEMMKSSQNLLAQILFLQVGANKPSIKDGTAEQNSIAEMRRFLKEIGIQPGTVVTKEGAGLSPATQIAPSAVVALLLHMTHHRHCTAFTQGLPYAGVDGTLKTRFAGTPAEKHVWAKTGTMEGTSALSGYISTQGNQHWAFSVMLNHYSGGKTTPREETDALVALLASCPDPTSTPAPQPATTPTPAAKP
jgi:D-alanyl-D-alanine carboxypeptidase/D-alanyl-D-alanine-endopeptidase (penicillin-binding protein 4)